MIYLKKSLIVCFSLSLVSSPVSAVERGPQLSLWGEVACFTKGCSHWRLKPHVSIPALQELTVCFKLKFEAWSSSTWTAFMYRHPKFQHAELGLGGKYGHLVVWLCGLQWTTPEFSFRLSQWYSLCLTWSHTKDKPDLYIDGNMTAYISPSPSSSSSCSNLAPDGTLTLGASHTLNHSIIQIIPVTALLGKLSLFRLWGRERSAQEVTSLNCTEGDLLKWEADSWDTQVCAPLPDSNLRCEWSIYEVTLMFAIFCYDGNNTEMYTAKDKALRWLEDVLPMGIYLHMLTVSEVTGSREEDSLVKSPHKDMTERLEIPNINSYDCLVHVSVTPSMNVADVQRQMDAKLRIPYDLSRDLHLVADPNSIYTRPVESFPASTIKPGVVTEASPAATTLFTTATSTSTLNPITTFKTTITTSSPSTTASTTSSPSTSTSSPSTTASTTSSPSTSTSSPSNTASTTSSPSTSTSSPSTTASTTSSPSTSTSSPSTTSSTTSNPSTTTSSPSTTTSSPSTTAPTTSSLSTTASTTSSPSTTVSTTSNPSTSASTTSSPSTTASTTSSPSTTASTTSSPSTTTSSPSTTAFTTSSPSTTASTTSSPSTTASTTSSPSTTASSTSSPSTTTSSPFTTAPTTSSPSTTASTTSSPSTTTSSPSTTASTTSSSSTTASSTSSPSTTTSTTSCPSTTTSSPSTTALTTSSLSTTSSSTSSPSTTAFTTSNPYTTTSSPSISASTTSSPSTTASTTSSTSAATSTTFTTSPANISDQYFEVSINVSITGECDPELTLSTWLNSSLPNSMMMVLDLQLLSKAQRLQTSVRSKRSTSEGVITRTVLRESCVFQVQVMSSLSDTQETEQLIQDLLRRPYDNGSISIATEDIKISHISIVNCDAESQQTRKGLFEWAATTGGKKATQPCPKNLQRHATRYCKLGLITHWMDPDLEDCPLVVETIPDLDDIEVTAGNALDVVEMIEDLLSNHSTLNYQELVTVLRKLQDVVTLSIVTPNLGQALINIISNILESDSNLVPFTNTILNITETVGDKMVGYEGSSTLVAPALAITVVDVVPGRFDNLTFGVSSDRGGTNPEIFINRDPFNSTVAFISLPSVLQHNFPQKRLNQNPPRVQFQFYGIPVLFKGSQRGKTLNTFVVSASVTNASSPVKDLNENVKVMLQHLLPNTVDMNVECVYWNFNKNNGNGGWDNHGCRKYNSSSDYTTCLCDHLTHFGVLLDVSRTELDPANEQILTIITYVGCGVSSLFLGVTALTYTAFEKLRRDYPSQILINLSLALLGLNLAFLANSWMSSWGVHGLCVAAASTLHYFLLASFTWMGLEAVNMYFALVKVFNVYVPSYMLKFCVLGWGFPLVVCLLVLIGNREAYGSHLYTDAQSGLGSLDNSDNFCWLQDDVTFYVSVVAYAALVFLFNIVVFVVVLMQIRHMRVNSPAGTSSGLMHDLRGVASITLLLGLTWTVGFFTWGPARVVLLYLFSGLNTLQGLFIFLFHCLMKENVRKQWRIHLCVGRFRLDEYSEWSNSASVGVVAKPRSLPPKTSVPSVRSVKSSSTDSTSASSDSSQREQSCRRPDLGLFVNSLALPRAQRSPTSPGAPASQRDINPTPGWRNRLLGHGEQRQNVQSTNMHFST